MWLKNCIWSKIFYASKIDANPGTEPHIVQATAKTTINSTLCLINTIYIHLSLYYFISSAEIKGFNFLSNTQKALYKKIDEITLKSDYATENLADLLFHQNSYKLIGTELSRQRNAGIPQKITSIGSLEKENDGCLFVSLESSKILSFTFIKCNRII